MLSSWMFGRAGPELIDFVFPNCPIGGFASTSIGQGRVRLDFSKSSIPSARPGPDSKVIRGEGLGLKCRVKSWILGVRAAPVARETLLKAKPLTFREGFPSPRPGAARTPRNQDFRPYILNPILPCAGGSRRRRGSGLMILCLARLLTRLWILLLARTVGSRTARTEMNRAHK
jgi:hypothetical protein